MPRPRAPVVIVGRSAGALAADVNFPMPPREAVNIFRRKLRGGSGAQAPQLGRETDLFHSILAQNWRQPGQCQMDVRRTAHVGLPIFWKRISPVLGAFRRVVLVSSQGEDEGDPKPPPVSVYTGAGVVLAPPAAPLPEFVGVVAVLPEDLQVVGAEALDLRKHIKHMGQYGAHKYI